MKADNFCYWMQGLMELGNPDTIDEVQLADIKAHLRMVFKYDIDLKYGGEKHQRRLSQIHNPSNHEVKIKC